MFRVFMAYYNKKKHSVYFPFASLVHFNIAPINQLKARELYDRISFIFNLSFLVSNRSVSIYSNNNKIKVNIICHLKKKTTKFVVHHFLLAPYCVHLRLVNISSLITSIMKVYLFNYALLYDNIKTDLIQRRMQE